MIKCYILFCRRSQESQGTAEQVFLYKENAERQQKEYQKHYADDTDFYIRSLNIQDWEQFLGGED